MPQPSLGGEEVPYQSQRVQALGEALSLEHQAQLVDLSLLLGSEVSGMTLQRLGRLNGVVIVVVFLAEFYGRHGGGWFCEGLRGRS